MKRRSTYKRPRLTWDQALYLFICAIGLLVSAVVVFDITGAA